MTPKLFTTANRILLPQFFEPPKAISGIDITFAEIQVNNILVSNIETTDDRLLIAHGTRISQAS